MRLLGHVPSGLWFVWHVPVHLPVKFGCSKCGRRCEMPPVRTAPYGQYVVCEFGTTLPPVSSRPTVLPRWSHRMYWLWDEDLARICLRRNAGGEN